ncbi:unnamed protein product [Brachionus calyciflorus]|uniref:Aromatic-L-amino-acid decarboxylase n=1 Tax=Brachionus calyciflorus TaxID=104777 RepID=A0A813NZY6_9BILA|nr:unnamed protein product [Brachionus calyciflorus]
MNSKEFRIHGKEMIDLVADYLETIENRQVLPSVQPGYLKELIPSEAPDNPDKWDDLISDIERVIMPGLTHWQSPHFHAYFPIANSYPSICADIFSDATACMGFSWISSPACTELEVVMMDWLAKLLSLPEFYLASSGGLGGGVIQGAASESVLIILLSARNKAIHEAKLEHPEWSDHLIRSKLVAYCSELTSKNKQKKAKEQGKQATNEYGNQETRRQILEEIERMEGKEIDENEHENEQSQAESSTERENDQSNMIIETIEEVLKAGSSQINQPVLSQTNNEIQETTLYQDEGKQTNAISNTNEMNQIRKRWQNIEGSRNDVHLDQEQQVINSELEQKYPRQKYEVVITGENLRNFNDIYTRIKEIHRCKGINNPLTIHPWHDVENDKHSLTIAVNNIEEYKALKNDWPKDAFGLGVKTTDKPPNLFVIINNVDKNIKIDQNDARMTEIRKRYGVIDIERIYGQDKNPSNKVKANVLTLFNYIDILKNGIYLDFTSIKHNVKPSINYSKTCNKCGNLNHSSKECRNRERCLKCGSYDHLIFNCENSPKCINCNRAHQCNSDACDILANKTLNSNKYILDILVKENIIQSVETIFKIPRVIEEPVQKFDLNENFEKIIKNILDEKLSDHNIRLNNLENSNKEQKTKIHELKGDILNLNKEVGEINCNVSSIKKNVNVFQTDLNSVKTDVNNVESDMILVKQDVNLANKNLEMLKKDFDFVKNELNGLNTKFNSFNEMSSTSHTETHKLLSLVLERFNNQKSPNDEKNLSTE